MDGMLSQDEINALLSGMNTDNNSDTATDSSASNNENEANKNSDIVLTDSEKDAVGEISNISMGTAATTLSSLLNQKVSITTPKVNISTWEDLTVQYDRPCVMLQISYEEGLDGNNVLVLKEKDVKIITDLMMGGNGEVDDTEQLTDLHLSAIGEAMNQMMGSAATSMSSMFNKKIDISPPVANVIENYSDADKDIPSFLNGNFVLVAFNMKIGNLVDSEIMQLYPVDFAKELLEMFSSGDNDKSAADAEQNKAAGNMNSNSAVDNPSSQNNTMGNAATQQTGTQNNNMAYMNSQMGMGNMNPQMGMAGMNPQMGMGNMNPQMGMGNMNPQMGMAGMNPQMGMQYNGQAVSPMNDQQNVNIQPALFQPFSNDINSIIQKENIDLIKDVPLEVTVELGRTKKSIKEILEFAPGTIVELNKIAGEAIDVLVNGKYVAKGEVVVIEESFGVRITEIIKDNKL